MPYILLSILLLQCFVYHLLQTVYLVWRKSVKDTVETLLIIKLLQCRLTPDTVDISLVQAIRQIFGVMVTGVEDHQSGCKNKSNYATYNVKKGIQVYSDNVAPDQPLYHAV